MGDILKLSRDKRHRSSSSLAGVGLDSTFSERKFDIKALIPEADDHFATAEARCEDLQEKIDLVRSIKRKNKLKKRSATRVPDQQISLENVPFISVRTQPKRKISQHAVRRQRFDANTKTTCGYIDPALLEQQKIIGKNAAKTRVRSGRAGGDEAEQRNEQFGHKQRKQSSGKIPRQQQLKNPRAFNLERPVVELFNKNRNSSSQESLQENVQVTPEKRPHRVHERLHADEATGPLEISPHREEKNELPRPPRRSRFRMHRNYERSTVASRIKQTGVRFYSTTTNNTNIPFIVSKSTAPSHNIGVNLQQVLKGLKSLQPLSHIPSTIAHRMGLGHIPSHGSKSAHAAPLESQDINSIKLGGRIVRLPTRKYISPSRLLRFFLEGDGMVPRFLRGVNRPHYFYTSMYNLDTNREDIEATSKGHAFSQVAKQSLTEYAGLFREYEEVENRLKTSGFKPELASRRNELQAKMASKEEHIRRVVQHFEKRPTELSTLRPSTSVATDCYRQSKFNMNGDNFH